jgi:hypothetical protein
MEGNFFLERTQCVSKEQVWAVVGHTWLPWQEGEEAEISENTCNAELGNCYRH